MLVDARLIRTSQNLLERSRIFLYGVQHAALTLDPTFIALPEDAIEKFVRDHLRRQGAVAARPAQVALDALTERFLRHAELQRAKSRFAADPRGNQLIDRGAARTMTCK